MATENNFPEYQHIRDWIDGLIEQNARRAQVAAYHGLPPEPNRNGPEVMPWEEWVDWLDDCNNVDRGASIIDEQLLASHVRLPHRRP